MRSELEATHGHRLTAVLIDKAIQWQERTMRAKWLWQTWVHAGLLLVVAMEVLVITFNVMFIIPRYKKLFRDGLLDPNVVHEQGIDWMMSFLDNLSAFTGGYTTQLVLGVLLAWGLFEWRIRSENKSLMRLSALGTVATVLMVVVALTAGALVVLFTMGIPSTGKVVHLYAQDQVAAIDTSIAALDQARAKQDWAAMQEQAERASASFGHLADHPSAIPQLKAWTDPIPVEELQEAITAARGHLGEAQQAIRDKDAAKLGVAMEKFRKVFEPVSAGAKRSQK